MKYKLIALLQDRPGVLNRIGGVFRRRDINVESMFISKTNEPGVSRMIAIVEFENNIDAVLNQLEKLIDVFEVRVDNDFGSNETFSPITWCQADGVV